MGYAKGSLSEESLQKMRDSQKRRFSKLSERKKVQTASKKGIEARKKLFAEHPELAREMGRKVSASKQRLAKDPEYRKRVRKNSRAGKRIYWAKEENHDKLSKAVKKLWKKKSFQDKMWESTWGSIEYKNRTVAAIARGSGTHAPNKAELKLNKILQENFPREFKLNTRGGFVMEGKIPDFVNVNGKKVVVEMFGTYWHGQEKTGNTPREEERVRRKIFARYGFRTAIVWEEELNYRNLVCEKIRKVLKDC